MYDVRGLFEISQVIVRPTKNENGREKKRKEMKRNKNRKIKNDFTFSLTAISLGRGYSEGLEGKTVFLLRTK